MTDGPARDEALNIGQSYIVQAPAGSGKTTLLISRYLCLLAVAEQPEEVLAITFTRKATAEMRKRVLEVLDPNNSIELPQAAANRAVQIVRQRSEELGWNLFEQSSRLQILTIDALCTALIRRMPWASRFGSLPGILDDPQPVYEAAALNLYESPHQQKQLRKALRRLLRHLDNNSGKLQGLIVQLLAKRDQWLRHLVQSSFSKQDRRHMESLWQSLISAQLDKTRDMMPTHVRIMLSLDRINHADPDGLNHWKRVADLLLIKNGNWRTQVPAKWQIPWVEELHSWIEKEGIKELLTNCREVPDLNTRLKEIRDDFPPPKYEKSQWRVLKACSIVLQHAVAELKLEFRKLGQVDFIEISQQAVAALGDTHNPTDLSLVLDYQYRHIMVDEFQDTSVTQRDLLELLTAGWQHNDGRTVFLVGDPMQSIYRFREAEVGIYLSVMAHGLGTVKIKPLQLTQNFRSNEGLIEWFNQVFAPSFPAQVELQTGSVPYVKCTTDKAPTQSQAVKIWLQSQIDESDAIVKNPVLAKNEADQLLEDLKCFRDSNPGSDVRAAILVRSRRHADEIIQRLVPAGIKFYAPEFIPLNERPVVEDLLSLTRALLNLADRTSWMAILRAPWCGLTLADLLVVAKDPHALIWERISDDAVWQALSEDGRDRVQRLHEVFKKTFAARGRLELRQWIEDCWTLLGGPACVAPHDYDNAQLLLNLIERYARGNALDSLSQFEDKIAKLFAVPEVGPDETWLQISTMHSAKGLEYDAVFLPNFQARRVGFPSSPLLVWSEFFLDQAGTEMLLSPIVPTGRDKEHTMYKFLEQWEKKRTCMELLRLAYVACTRAKQRLYIYAATKNRRAPEASQANEQYKSKNSLLALLWPGLIATEFAQVQWVPNFAEPELKEGQNDPMDFSIARLPRDWQLPAPPAAVPIEVNEFESPDQRESIDFDWAGSVALWIGNVVHEWLERFVRTGVHTWSAGRLAGERHKWQVRLQAMGMDSGGGAMDDALDRIAKALNHVLEDPQGQWILSSEHQESEAELRLTGYYDNQFVNVILDRSFVDEQGSRWIVDYKSGMTSGDVEAFLNQEVGRYREQLVKYKAIVSGMDSRPIRTALYFPMFPAWREVT